MKDGPFDRPDSRFNTLKDWTWIGCYGGYYLQSDLLHDQGFEHGFFTRLWNDRGPDQLAGYISAGISVHRPRQIHSGIVLKASDASQDPWPEADGLVSDRGGQSLWVCGADCTPVLIADPGTGHAAACHTGWRGVAAGIVITALNRLVDRGAQREDLVIALGPAVSGPCYQVGEEVVQAITSAIPGEASLGGTGALLPDEQAGRHRLDIRVAARLQLQQAGIAGSRIAHCPLCTVSEPELFYSWRRDQVKAVQWSGIVAQAPT